MRTIRWAVLCIALGGCSTCSGERDDATPAPASEASARTDELPARAPERTEAPDRGLFELALVWPSIPERDPIATFRETCAAIPTVDALPAAPTGIAAVVDVPDDYVAPDMRLLGHFGRGLSEERARALQTDPTALVIAMESTPARAAEAARALTECASAIASATDGSIWDESTRLMWSPEAWREGPVRDWEDGVPAMTEQITVHAIPRDEGGLRAVTLGMQKLARSDLVIPRFEEQHGDSMGRLLTWIGQTMIEGAEPDGAIALDASSIRDRITQQGIAPASVARIALRPSAAEEGDPPNRLLEPVFPGPDELTLVERQALFLRSVFGVDREISHVDHDDELDRLISASRAELRALRERFVAGLPAGQHLHVAALFGGSEIMWIDVTAWPEPDRLVGRLMSEPEQPIAHGGGALHGGATVEVGIADAMDYTLIGPEGRLAGGRAYDRAIAP